MACSGSALLFLNFLPLINTTLKYADMEITQFCSNVDISSHGSEVQNYKCYRFAVSLTLGNVGNATAVK
jgi:hypothetical protein